MRTTTSYNLGNSKITVVKTVKDGQVSFAQKVEPSNKILKVCIDEIKNLSNDKSRHCKKVQKGIR